MGPVRTLYWSALLLLGLAGCGEGEPTRAEAAGAVRAVDAYLSALGGRDYSAACARLSERQRGSGCAGVLDAGLADVPDEVLADLADAETTLAGIDGKVVEVTVRGSGAFASKPKTSTVPVERQAGEWRIVGLPDVVDKDPVTGCVVTSIHLYEAGKTYAYWRKQGREDYVEYSRRLCQAIVKQGVDPDSQQAIAPLAGQVIRDMVREGRVEQP
jgi:hypothetical protein